MTASARLGQQRELPGQCFLGHLVGERGRIFAGEAMIGELRPQGIAPLETHGAINAVDGKEGQRIVADEAPHALDVAGRSDDTLSLRAIDSIIIRTPYRESSDAATHLLG